MEDYKQYGEQLQPEAQFNSGVAITYEIHNLCKMASQSRIIDNFPLVHKSLFAVELKMSPKFRINEKARNEIEDIHKKYTRYWQSYIRRVTHEPPKKIPREVMEQVQNYLNEYERAILYYRDVWNYGMPNKEDRRKAAWR